MKKAALRLERIRDAHEKTDRDLATVFAQPQNKSVALTCSKGCSACCSEPVYAERREAELAAHAIEAMPHTEREEAKARLRAWLERMKAAPEILAQEQPHVMPYRKLGLSCPLLKDQLCSIYKDRPWGCRLHYAVGPRENCEDDAKRLTQSYAYVPDVLSQRSTLSLLGNGDGSLEMEHFGLLLAEIVLGERVESASRSMIKVTFTDRKGGA